MITLADRHGRAYEGGIGHCKLDSPEEGSLRLCGLCLHDCDFSTANVLHSFEISDCSDMVSSSDL